MKTINYRGVDQSGVNCKGFTLVCNFGYYYLACKVEHTPEDPWLGLPVADFFSSTVFGEQFLYALNPLKNDNDIIGRLFYYLDGEQYQQNNYNQHQQVELIAQQLHQRNLLIYPLQDKKRLFSNLHFPPPPKIIAAPVKVIEKIIRECKLKYFSLKCGHDGHIEPEKKKDSPTTQREKDVDTYKQYEKYMATKKVGGNRNYTHQVLTGKYKDQIFNVVGKDTIEVRYSGSHKGASSSSCPTISIKGASGKIENSGEKFEVLPPQNTAPEIATAIGALGALRFEFNDFKAYSVTANGCSYSYPVEVRAYDTYVWGLYYELSYKVTDKKWSVVSRFEGNIADKPYKLNLDNNFLTDILNGLNTVFSAIEHVSSNASQTNGKTLKDFITPPKIIVGGNLSLNEKNNSPDLALDGEINFEFTPLLGLNFEFDLVEWLIRYFLPGVGEIVIEAKQDAESGFTVNGVKVKGIFKIALTAKTEINFKSVWSYTNGVCSAINSDDIIDNTSGFILGLEFKPQLSGEISSFIASVSAEVSTTATGVDSPAVGLVVQPYATVIDNEPALQFRVIWTGLKMVYVSYVKAGLGNMSEDLLDDSDAPDAPSINLDKQAETPKPKNLMDYKPKTSLNAASLSFTGGDENFFTKKRESTSSKIIMAPRVIYDTGEKTALKFKDINFNSGKYEDDTDYYNNSSDNVSSSTSKIIDEIQNPGYSGGEQQ